MGLRYTETILTQKGVTGEVSGARNVVVLSQITKIAKDILNVKIRLLEITMYTLCPPYMSFQESERSLGMWLWWQLSAIWHSHPRWTSSNKTKERNKVIHTFGHFYHQVVGAMTGMAQVGPIFGSLAVSALVSTCRGDHQRSPGLLHQGSQWQSISEHLLPWKPDGAVLSHLWLDSLSTTTTTTKVCSFWTFQLQKVTGN